MTTARKATRARPSSDRRRRPQATQAPDVEEAQDGGDHDGGEGRGRDGRQQTGHDDEQHDDGARADEAGDLRPGAGRLRDRGARRAPAGREPTEQAGRHVHDAEGPQLVVGVHALAAAGGERVRDDARVGERDQGDPERRREEGHQVGPRDGREADGRQPARYLADHLQLGREAEDVDDHARRHDGHEDARDPARDPPQPEDQRQAAHPDEQGDRDDLPVGDPLHQANDATDDVIGVHGEAQQLRELGDHDREGDAVHVADPDRPRQEVGDEAQARDRGSQAQEPGHDREGAGEGDRADGIAAGEGDDGRRDQGQQRRVRPEDEDPRRPHQEVGDEGADRGIQTRDRGQAGGLRVAHANGHEEGGQGQAGDDVVPEPATRVGAEPGDRRKGGRQHGPDPAGRAGLRRKVRQQLRARFRQRAEVRGLAGPRHRAWLRQQARLRQRAEVRGLARLRDRAGPRRLARRRRLAGIGRRIRPGSRFGHAHSLPRTARPPAAHAAIMTRP